MPRKAHGFLPHGGEEAAEVADAQVQPTLPRGLVSISTHWDGAGSFITGRRYVIQESSLAPALAL